MERRLKIALIVLLIILISIISFLGLFVQDTKFMKNLLPEYKLGMDLKGHRAITVNVSDEEETIYYDKDGNEVNSEVEGGKTEKKPVNAPESLTAENYKKAKELVEKRFSDLNLSEYIIRLNENNGSITAYLPENDMIDIASQFVYSKGEFTIENEDGEILLDSNNLDNVRVGYSSTETGTAVHLSFEFKDDCIDKLKEITNTYVKSTDEEGKDTSKKVLIKVDENTLLQTSFSEEIVNGILPLTLGTTTDTETLNTYIQKASNIAILINNGPLPIDYTVDQNRFIKSDLTMQDAIIPLIVIGAILVIAFLVLIIKYKKLGLLSIISYIGYLALLLIVIRYTNLVITLEGIFGILIAMVLNYVFLIYLLQSLKKTTNIAEVSRVYNKSILSIILILVPAVIIGVVFAFAVWLPAYSFGTIIFWSLLIMILYNVSITRILLLNSIKK